MTVGTILSHPTYDNTWRVIEQTSSVADRIEVPMLLIGGWFDHFPEQVLRAFEDLRRESAPGVRDHHRLIIGPWTHSGIGEATQGELTYPDADSMAMRETLRFLHRWLKEAPNGWDATPPVRYYQMGENRWKDSESWSASVARTDTVAWYLRGARTLSRGSIGVPDLPPDFFPYDPRDPSPTHGGSYFDPFSPSAPVGPHDQREVVESRSDALVYSSAQLETPVEVVGMVAADLVVSSDRFDTDVAVRLTDVYPDGRSMLLLQGIRRMRFRNGLRPADTAAMIPGERYHARIELGPIAQTFLPGHRIRIIVTGSNHPHFAANPNTGAPLYAGGDSLIATNLLYLAPGEPSRLILPVVREASVEREGERSEANRGRVVRIGEDGLLVVGGDARAGSPLELFTILGERVATIAPEAWSPSERRIVINGLPAGVYVVRWGEKR